jgi:hypothetical protein
MKGIKSERKKGEEGIIKYLLHRNFVAVPHTEGGQAGRASRN